MGNVLNYDGPLMSGLGKIADLVILNFLTLLFCLPLVTIGASITAAHYVALKIHRGEGYVWKNFWKSFKENLKQSTIIWLMFALGIGVCVVAYIYIMFSASGMGPVLICTVLFVLMLFMLMTSMWVFPMQSKFINDINTTIKNAFFMAFKHLLRTFLMLIIHVLPVVVFFLGVKWHWILICFGFSVPIFLCAMLYNKKFKMIEEMIEDRQLEEQQNAN